MAEPTGTDDSDAERRPAQPPPAAATVGLVLDLGLRLGLSVILGLGLGLLVDNWLRSSPTFTLVGMLLGIGAAMYTIWDVARRSMRR